MGWIERELEGDDGGYAEGLDDVNERPDLRPIEIIPDPEGACDDFDDTDEQREAFLATQQYGFAPSLEEAQQAVVDLKKLLYPKRGVDRPIYGYKPSKLDHKTHTRLDHVFSFLARYSSYEKATPGRKGNWTHAAKETAEFAQKSDYYSKQLRLWAKNFISDGKKLPPLKSHSGGAPAVIDDDDVIQDIQIHLQGIGKYIKARDIVDFCGTSEMLERLGRTKSISESTARRWLVKMGYRWVKNPKGQYVDGHEREDVVIYRETVYVPRMMKLVESMHCGMGLDGLSDWRPPLGVDRPVVIWFHDESTFYAHDRRQNYWMPPNSSPEPTAKGEGQSMMVANFVSADYGWLQSPDGSESAQVIFQAGKDRDGWMTNDNILAQLDRAITILQKYYPNEHHVFVYDNATTHSKRDDGALSAMKMPKSPSDKFFVDVNVVGADGRLVYGSDGKLLKVKQQMEKGLFNGKEQDLYYPDDHPTFPGWFKGMAQILTERGWDIQRKKAQCGSSFKHDCPKGSTNCCCRRILYNEPDFRAVESRLEKFARERGGYEILFLPKFHCELNFIEQCWGYAKRNYRLLPPSSSGEILERNVCRVLSEIPLVTMRKFSIRALRFTDAYSKGLDGRQAAWAVRKYRGHRTLPESILRELTANLK
ncbi:hypothetical protein AN958_06325 [Leucoagaricus sp. SymC.cos]|nr:hypothetical protein AN958_06325 [Leucoagaricus sp. SymC.cos]